MRNKRNWLGFCVISICVAIGTAFAIAITQLISSLNSHYHHHFSPEVNDSWPLCTEGVLSRRNYDYAHHANQGLWLLKPRLGCRLNFYSQADFVKCLDFHHQSKDDDQQLHFAFIGDSRIRQYYYNFLKFVPNYDHPWQDPADHKGKHVSRNISSPLLHHMVVSFFWQPGLDEEVFKLVSNWADDDTTVAPHFLLIGITVHHMGMNLGDDHLKLARGLVELMVILERLQRRRNSIKIIWLNQPPTIDSIFYKREFYVRPFNIHSEKIERYNQVIQQTLKNASHLIKIWDSSNHVVEEYVRSCDVAERTAPQWIDTWMDCTDYIHPGYAAMTQTTQILINEMCNDALNNQE